MAAADIRIKLRDHLTERDGKVKRNGPAMLRLHRLSGYSIETLRSFSYQRRTPSPRDPRLAKLKRALRG